nr:hypothetical protein [Tanacetum cinerariifolium]
MIAVVATRAREVGRRVLTDFSCADVTCSAVYSRPRAAGARCRPSPGNHRSLTRRSAAIHSAAD